ncbi:hypothetical protein EJ08DRAFT_648326 [Tothia fuscella]|uniref:U4/U6.U5 small nuclear ribonucleoprotein 27kDa protein domain-containing protein n=1 Tax=Tothia fuscella TaxID=1048955 RepID=A0A9P4NV94_9PEZI|nr:hypothetical protein EJ08DRAFT_648326 [Tothia fuscella]
MRPVFSKSKGTPSQNPPETPPKAPPDAPGSTPKVAPTAPSSTSKVAPESSSSTPKVAPEAPLAAAKTESVAGYTAHQDRGFSRPPPTGPRVRPHTPRRGNQNSGHFIVNAMDRSRRDQADRGGRQGDNRGRGRGRGGRGAPRGTSGYHDIRQQNGRAESDRTDTRGGRRDEDRESGRDGRDRRSDNTDRRNNHERPRSSVGPPHQDQTRSRSPHRQNQPTDPNRRNRSPPTGPRNAPFSNARYQQPAASYTRFQPAKAAQPTIDWNVVQELPEDEKVSTVMGFGNFKTTKQTKVPGNEFNYGVYRAPKTTYRQYMNREGGFNRPLSPGK